MFSPIPKLRRGVIHAFTATSVLLVVFVLALPPAIAADVSTVRVKDGRVQEYVNGSLRRSYGSDARGDVDLLGRAVEEMSSRLSLDASFNGVPRHATLLPHV